MKGEERGAILALREGDPSPSVWRGKNLFRLAECPRGRGGARDLLGMERKKSGGVCSLPHGARHWSKKERRTFAAGGKGKYF